MIYILIVYIIVNSVILAKKDSDIIKGNKIKHWLNAVLIFVDFTIISTICFYYQAPLDLSSIKYLEVFEMLFSFLTLRWIVFDLAYNYFIGNNLFYVGKTSWIDINIRGVWSLLIKSICLFFSILFLFQWILR